MVAIQYRERRIVAKTVSRFVRMVNIDPHSSGGRSDIQEVECAGRTGQTESPRGSLEVSGNSFIRMSRARGSRSIGKRVENILLEKE